MQRISTTSRGLDVDDEPVAGDLEVEQRPGLPIEHLVGEALEGLPKHRESAAAYVPRAEMQVAEPAATPAVPPLRGQHDEGRACVPA